MMWKKLIPFTLAVMLLLVAVVPGALATDILTTDGDASITFGAGQLRIVEAPAFAMGEHSVPTGPDQIYKMMGAGSGVTGNLKVSDSRFNELFSVSAQMTEFTENGGSDTFDAELELKAGTPSVSTAVPLYNAKVVTNDVTITDQPGNALLGFATDVGGTDLVLTDYIVTWIPANVSLKITDTGWANIQQSKTYDAVITWTISTP